MTDPIKAKIQALVPEVMELRFGCNVIVKREKCIDYPANCAVIVEHDRQRYLTVSFGYDIGCSSIYHTDVEEILGSPITLAVVLRAINKPIKYYTKIPTVSIDVANLLDKWNLAQDNWDNQTPETRAFIGSLIGVE